MDVRSPDDLHTLKRRELQVLCKNYNIKANMKNSEMIKALRDLMKKKQSPCIEDCVNEENKDDCVPNNNQDPLVSDDGVLPVNPVPIDTLPVDPVPIDALPVDPVRVSKDPDSNPGDLGIPVSDNPDLQVDNPTTRVEDPQQLATPLVESAAIDIGLATSPITSSNVAPPTNNDSSPIIAEPDTTKAIAEVPQSTSNDEYAIITADELITSTWTPPCVIDSDNTIGDSTLSPVLSDGSATSIIKGSTLSPVLSDGSATSIIKGSTLSPIHNEGSATSTIEGSTLSPIHNEGSATSTIEGSTLSPIHNEGSATSINTNNSELSFTMDNASMRVNVGSPLPLSQSDTSSLSFSTCSIANQSTNNTDTTPVPSSIADTLNTTYTIESPEKEITVEGTNPASVLSESLTLTPSNSKHLGASPLCGSWLGREVTTSSISQLADKTSTTFTRTSTVESPLISSKSVNEVEKNAVDVKQNISSYHDEIMSLLDSRVEDIMNDPSYKPPPSDTSTVAKSNTAAKKGTITSKFDKIHARQFNRMESIVDSAQRKRKRLETITNEAPSSSDITASSSKKAKIQEPVKPKPIKKMTSASLNRLATPKRRYTGAEKKTLSSSKPAFK